MPASLLVPAAALAALGLASCAQLPSRASEPAPRVRGPLETRVQHPLALNRLSLGPRRAHAQPEGEWAVAADLAYSSLFENETTSAASVVVDAEFAHARARLRRGLGAGLDFELGLGVLYASGGFLDAFIESWHNFFGLPSGNRDSRPHQDYEVKIERQGETLYELEGHALGLLDTPLILTWNAMEESAERPGLALRLGLELPTGSESRGFGNGGLDLGAGLVLERTCGRWTFNGSGESIWAASSTAFDEAGVDERWQWALGSGAEYRWNDRLSLLGQLQLQAPLLEAVELNQIDQPILDLGLGAAWDVGAASRLRLSFHEDLISQVGSDFGLQLGWSHGW